MEIASRLIGHLSQLSGHRYLCGEILFLYLLRFSFRPLLLPLVRSHIEHRLTQDGKMLVSLGVGVAMRFSLPNAVLVKLDLLCRHLAIDHRAKFAIADRQGFFPLKRGLPLA